MNSVAVDVMVERVMLDTKAYVLFAGRHQDGQYVRVKTLKHIDPVAGEMYRVSGKEWRRPDAQGHTWRQIDAEEIVRIRTSGALIGRWLEHLPHVGEVRARRLINAFPDSLADVLSNVENLPVVAKVLDPGKPILATKIAAQIYATIALRDAKHLSVAEEIGFFTKLESLGVTDDRAARSLWRLVGGTDALQRLVKNPYLAASLLAWTKADHLGKSLLKERVSKSEIALHPDRLLGAVDNAWRDVLASGDTAATPGRFYSILESKGVDVEKAITLGIAQRRIIEANNLYRAPGAAWLENRLIAMLQTKEKATAAIDTNNWLAVCDIVAEAESRTGLKLHEEQRAAVQMLLMLPVGVLQGGAGVGKTTVMKVLVSAWELLGGNVIMGALAGKAALQLTRGTSSPGKPRLAYTVARMLRMINSESYESGDTGPAVDPDGITINDKTLLILDEASMLDTPSLHEVLERMPTRSRLLLVGDCGQLPPVGIGRVFHDLVQEGSRVVTLTKVLRQAHDSPVPSAAAAVREGKLPTLERWDGRENGIFWLEEPSKIHDLYSDLLKRSDDVMVVAALRATVQKFNDAAAGRRRIEAGVDAQTIRLGPLASVAVGDPVVCTQNRYKESLFNGLLGHVAEATPERVNVLWEGESEPRTLTKEIGAHVELAYAITCHRAQGSAAQYVIVHVEDSPLVTREWLYTAITRTRETVILVGRMEAIEKAVQRRSERTTGFKMPVSST